MLTRPADFYELHLYTFLVIPATAITTASSGEGGSRNPVCKYSYFVLNQWSIAFFTLLGNYKVKLFLIKSRNILGGVKNGI